MAFTATVLSWDILEYGNHMNMVSELDNAHESLKWITNFLINAHPSENVMYIQVGDPKLDHTCWKRPEEMTRKRPLTQVNVSYPGTDVAAESAAAMAAASLVCKSIDSAYSGTLLKHAKQLFKFADSYRDGLVWVNQWNPFQYSVASLFLAVVYSDYMLSSQTSNLYCSGKLYEPTELRNFAVSQLDYILGDNPMEMSYLVGYGSRYPQQVHHRGASIPVNVNSNCSDGFTQDTLIQMLQLELLLGDHPLVIHTWTLVTTFRKVNQLPTTVLSL